MYSLPLFERVVANSLTTIDIVLHIFAVVFR